MKKKMLLFFALFGIFPIFSLAQIYIPNDVETETPFIATIELFFKDGNSAIPCLVDVSGTNINITLAVSEIGGVDFQPHYERVDVEIPALPEGQYNINISNLGWNPVIPPPIDFTIPYDSPWDGELPLLREETFLGYYYNGVEPAFIVTNSAVELVYFRRNDDARLYYDVQTRTNLTAGIWIPISVGVETNVFGGAFDKISVPLTNTQMYVRFRLEYQ